MQTTEHTPAQEAVTQAAPAEADPRAQARHDFFVHLRYYIVINLTAYFMYLFAESHGYWPLYMLLGWGVFLAVHFWRVFLRQRPAPLPPLPGPGRPNLSSDPKEQL